MSDVTDGDTIHARIERDLAESAKLRQESERFIAEQRKLIAEELKLRSEELKLRAEQMKLDRDRWLAPGLAVVGLIGGLVAIATLILRAVGHGS